MTVHFELLLLDIVEYSRVNVAILCLLKQILRSIVLITFVCRDVDCTACCLHRSVAGDAESLFNHLRMHPGM